MCVLARAASSLVVLDGRGVARQREAGVVSVVGGQRGWGLLGLQLADFRREFGEGFLNVHVLLGTRLYEFHVMQISIFLEGEEMLW